MSGDEISFIHPSIWKNFTRESPHLPQQFLEYILQTPIYTKTEFLLKTQRFENSLRDSYMLLSMPATISYSPNADLNSLEYAKCNYLYKLFCNELHPEFITNFQYRKIGPRMILLHGNLYSSREDIL